MADETSESAASESEPTPTSVEASPSASAEKADLSEVHSKFADVFKDADDDAVEEASAETPATEAKPAETKETEVAAGEQQAEKPPTPAANPTTSPVIPAAYTRSLKALGWSDEEIVASHKADPANFFKAAAKLHESRNEETRRLSDLGRLAKQQADSQQPQTPAASPVFDIAALKKTYGEKEPFIAQLELLNKTLEAQQQWVSRSQAAQAKAEADALGRQIDGFFGSKDLADHAEAYGKAADGMKPEQEAARMKVLETAELLIRGAKMSGRTMSLEDALTMAHDSVSGPVKTQAVRNQIVAQAKTRNAAISLKPGARSAPKPAAGDRKVLESVVGKGLASVFKS